MSDWEDITDSEWEEIPTPEANPGVLDYVAAPFQKSFANLADAYAGLQMFRNDLKDSVDDTLSEIPGARTAFNLTPLGFALGLGASKDTAKGIRDWAQQLNTSVDAGLNLDPEGFGKRALDVTSEVAPAAISLLGGPATAAAYIGTSSAGRKYGALDELQNPDGSPALTPIEKMLDAGLTGGLNAAMSYVPLSFLGRSTGSLPTRLLKESFKVGSANAALAPFQVTGNAVIDRATAGLPTSREDLGGQIGTAIGDSFITAPFFGAMGALSGRPGVRPQRAQSKVDPIESVIDSLADQGGPVQPLAPEVMAQPDPIAPSQDPNFFITNPDQLPVPVQPAGLPAEFPMNVPGPRSNWQPPAPEGFNRGDDFLFKDPAQPPALRPDVSAPVVVNDPTIDPTQYQGPKQGFALDAQPQDPAALTTPPLEEPSGYSSSRSPYRQQKATQAVQSVEADLARTRQRIADQERVNRTNEAVRESPPSPIIKAEQSGNSFDDPMARIARAAEEAKSKEPPLIATPDNSPLTVREVLLNTARTIYNATKTSERGAISKDLLGLGRVSKEVKDATKGDPRYTKYEPKHILAARNWVATDTIGRDVPEVKPLADAILNLAEDNSRTITSVEPELMALYKMQGDESVNGVIWKAEEKGAGFQLTPENIAKLNLSDEQVAAIQASKNLQLKASAMLQQHSNELANREYNYTVKRANLEAPVKKREFEQKYQADLDQLRTEALDPTDPRVLEETNRLREKLDADLLGVDTWLSETVNRAANERYNALRAIEQRHATWDQTNYVPRNRYGKFKMKVFDANGELYEDRQTDSRAELTKWKKAYEDAGYVTTIDTLKQRAPTEHFNGVSDEVATSVDPVGGFKKHLMKSRRVPGADMDPVRAWSEYFRGLSKKMALDRMEMTWKEAMLELPRDPKDPRQIDVNLSQAVNALQQRKDAILDTKSESWRYLSKLTDLSNLTFQLRTPISNLFAIPQRQYPELTKYGAQPEMTIAKSFGINLNRLRMDDATFAKKYPELAQGIATAEANKVITPTAKSAGKWGSVRAPLEKQVSRIADNKNKTLSTLDDVAFFLQFHSDRFAETNGFITGWEAYPQAVKHFRKNNLEVPSRQQFAEQFSKDTKANVKSELLPPWMQGAAQSTTLKYKTWQFRYLGALLDAAGKGNKAYVGRAMAATLASAGVRGLPFYKTLVGAMTALGFSPEDSLQKVLDENLPDGLSEPAMQTITYGPLSAATGINFSGSTGFGDPLPDTSRGFEAAIGSLVGGPAASLGRKMIDFPGYLKRGQTDRALENLPVSIPLITNLAKAYRYASEGVVTKGGIGIVPKGEVTDKMLLAQLLGYGDLKTARAYDKYLAGERAGAGAQDSISYPSLIAEAIVRGDMERARALELEAIRAGKPPKLSDINEKVAKRRGQESVIIKKYPKATRDDAAAARGRF